MYRVTSHILSSRSMLYCRPAAEFQLKSVSRCGPHLQYKKVAERDTCPRPLPPPPPPPKDDSAFWGALSLLVLTGGFAFFAQQSPEMRDWLTIHAPWFDDFIAVIYQENMSYKEFAEQCVENMKKYANNYFDDTKPKQCSLDGEDVKQTEEIQAPQEGKPKDVCHSGKGNQEGLDGVAGKKGICDIEFCIKDLAGDIINNYMTARDACIYYNKVTEEAVSERNIKKIKMLDEAKAERLDLLRQSEENICSAGAEMDELVRYVECGGMQAPKDKLVKIMQSAADLRAKISEIRLESQWENYKSLAYDDEVKMITESADGYIEQNQTLFPGLNYDDKKPVLRGDADMFLFQNFRLATYLKATLCQASCGMTNRIDRALENLPTNPIELKKRNLTIQTEFKKRKDAIDKEFKKRIEDQKLMNQKILKMHLGGHDEALQAKVAQREKELLAVQDKLVAEKVAAEKKNFAAQLAAIEAKIKVVEDKIRARLEAERQSRRSQELYAAGASLMAATKKGDSVVRIDKELKAIEKASGGEDKLVLTILKSIPETVRTKGIVPESILRERYHRMEKAALRVALVEQDGGPLPIFILSWMQSLMLFMKLSSIPQVEADKLPSEPSKDLDTFDLLQRARYWMERGNLPVALRYVSSLEGASRLAASTWFNEARSYLEIKQAAEAVLAHATALGLQYV